MVVSAYPPMKTAEIKTQVPPIFMIFYDEQSMLISVAREREEEREK